MRKNRSSSAFKATASVVDVRNNEKQAATAILEAISASDAKSIRFSVCVRALRMRYIGTRQFDPALIPPLRNCHDHRSIVDEQCALVF